MGHRQHLNLKWIWIYSKLPGAKELIPILSRCPLRPARPSWVNELYPHQSVPPHPPPRADPHATNSPSPGTVSKSLARISRQPLAIIDTVHCWIRYRHTQSILTHCWRYRYTYRVLPYSWKAILPSLPLDILWEILPGLPLDRHIPREILPSPPLDSQTLRDIPTGENTLLDAFGILR